MSISTTEAHNSSSTSLIVAKHNSHRESLERVAMKISSHEFHLFVRRCSPRQMKARTDVPLFSAADSAT